MFPRLNQNVATPRRQHTDHFPQGPQYLEGHGANGFEKWEKYFDGHTPASSLGCPFASVAQKRAGLTGSHSATQQVQKGTKKVQRR
jgi:hypothetical protein